MNKMQIVPSTPSSMRVIVWRAVCPHQSVPFVDGFQCIECDAFIPAYPIAVVLIEVDDVGEVTVRPSFKMGEGKVAVRPSFMVKDVDAED